ncbi:hypothetical protein Tco_0513191, partial [Tanacetum coccineum]
RWCSALGDGCVGDGCVGDGCDGATVICSGVWECAGECSGECSGEWEGESSGDGKGSGEGEDEDVILEGEVEGAATSNIVGKSATSCPEKAFVGLFILLNT